MHAPSVGEGLQARVVIELVRSRRPDIQLAYTFFSPSAEAFAHSLDVDFTGSGTDSDGTIISWSWAFGDGGTSSLQSPSHTYATPGNYTARLEVTDNQGNTGVDTIDIILSDPEDGVEADPFDIFV